MKFCAGCNNVMVANGERPGRFAKRKYCCDDCYRQHTSYRRNYRDLTNQTVHDLLFLAPCGREPKSGGVMWLVKCYCGKLFATRPTRIFQRTTKSCGCYRSETVAARGRGRIGPLHPSWKSELTDEDRTRKNIRSEAVKEWRNQVYQRDNYTCQHCGSQEGGTFNAHHLNGWAWCKGERYDVENGATLCVKCHKKFHNIYGNRHNTKKQFQEFQESPHAVSL